MGRCCSLTGALCRFYLYFERPSDGFNFVVMNNLLPKPKLHALLHDRLVEETELGTWAWKAMKATRTRWGWLWLMRLCRSKRGS